MVDHFRVLVTVHGHPDTRGSQGNHGPRHLAHRGGNGAGHPSGCQRGFQLLAGLFRYRRNALVRCANAFGRLCIVNTIDQGHKGRQRLDRLGAHNLVERRILGRWRAQFDHRHVRESPPELVRWQAIALGNTPQLLDEQLNVEDAGLFHDPVGVNLLGHRVEHPGVVLLLQVNRQ
ncbi:hypothetical protein D9M71_170980 [compost metagenome]